MADVTLRNLINTGDPITGPNGSPLAGVNITFQLVDAVRSKTVSLFDAVSGELIVGDPVTVVTDAKGEFTVPLWPNSRGEALTAYKVTVDDENIKPFLIRVDDLVGDITLVQAKTAMSAMSPQIVSLFQSAINESAIAATAATEAAIASAASATASASSATTSTTQAGIATTKAGEAAVSAATALASKNAADADAVATAADRVETGLDRTQTGVDKIATAADRVQTSLDKTQTGLDVIATAADRVQTGLDKASTTTNKDLATAKAGEAVTSATNAANSATAAAGSNTSAGTSATSAAGSASTATTQATTAATKASEAAASAAGAAAIVTGNTVAPAAGTALLPSLTTAGDLNTGRYYPAADTIADTVGGVEKQRISATAGVVPTTTTTGNPATGAGTATAQRSVTVIIPDALRQTVEAASGGRNTIIYTAKGQPSYMFVQPCFNLQDIDAGLGTGRHPAFIVNGVNKPEIFIGMYQASLRNGELLSLPGVAPTVNQSFDAFATQVASNGPGHHLISRMEWSAIALWAWKNNTQPRGNNNYGRDITNVWETGRRPDGFEPGYTASSGITLTGSGPASWRHDNTMTGIADLNGNIWEWCTGMRINGGEIQIISTNGISGNDAANNAVDIASGSASWKAIDGSTGALVAPGSANTVKYAASGTAAYTLVRTSGGTFEGMTNPGTTPVGTAALALCKTLGLYPVAATGLGGDAFYMDVTGERFPLAGGDWYDSGAAGVFRLSLLYPRSGVSGSVGARSAYVL